MRPSISCPHAVCSLSRFHLPLPFLLFFFSMLCRPPSSTLFPYTTLFRSLPRHISMHPCGVILGDQTLLDRTPEIEEHTSELQSRFDLVCRLLLEKKNFITIILFFFYIDFYTCVTVLIAIVF